MHAALLMLGSSDNQSEAEAKLHLSLQLARMQGARSIQLRSATALARIRAEHGNPADAIGLLAAAYETFHEGFDTPDLKEAAALMTELS